MEINELKVFYENVRKMRMHYRAYQKDHSSNDLKMARSYEKKVDEYIISRIKEERQVKIF